MKRVLILFFCIPLFAVAQHTPLQVEGTAPNFYLNHTVAPKENYYSIGRLYNISPKEIAPFNNLQLEKGLSLNQSIKVPLTGGNFTQSADAAADEALVPVYHTVKEKEGLYRVATNYNKLPLPTLKQWNKINGDAVANGTKLIIGYLRVKKELSALAGAAKPVPVTPAPAPVKEVPQPAKEVQPVVTAPVKESKPVVKPEVKEPVKETKTVAVEAPAKKDLPPQQPAPVKETAPAAPAYSGKSFNGGFFKNMYKEQLNKAEEGTEAGTAAVFKSNSGWEDGKYYCLHNGAAPGTIIKITNPANGKFVFAKVLDAMPDIRQNNNVLIRLSNAAASELGAGDKFDCTLSFAK